MVDHGVVLPTRGVVLWSAGRGPRSDRAREAVTALAVEAESLGYDAVWCGDSVTARPRLEPLVTLASVAGATETVTLGTAVYLPNLRHPVHVAHQTATLDVLSGGRLVLGVGIGGGSSSDRAEHAHLDVAAERRGRRLDESLDVIHGLWTGDPVSYDGEVFDLEDASIGIRPVRTPPVYLASTHVDPEREFPATLLDRFCAHGDGWLPIAFSPATYAAGADRLRRAVRDAGRDPSTVEFLYYQDVVIAESEASAVAEAREFLRDYYPWPLSDAQVRARGAFGPPARVVDHLEAYVEAGVETFVTRFPAADQRDQLKRYADLVAEVG